MRHTTTSPPPPWSRTRPTSISAMATGVDLVIFGASGDLARRKILPSLKHLAARNGTALRVIGAGRSEQTREEFCELVNQSSGSSELAATAEWVQLSYNDPASFEPVKGMLDGAKTAIFYLATPPETFSDILGAVGNSGMATKGDPSRRIVVEKPLGHDLASARKLNSQLAAAFDEEQIFRIDHYLAKDTVQNVLAFRFSNSLFEPVWNRNLVDTILITAAEEEGIGSRAGYYDQIGAVRDMIQNHVLQLLALVTMEPPTTFDSDYIRRAKRGALRAMSPLDPAQAVRGQYEGYLDEEGVGPDSRRATEIVIKLRDAPMLRVGGRRQRGIATLIVIRIQPDEGITLRIGAKRPGVRFEMVPAGMRLDYSRLTRIALPDAYENVLSEVIAGGHSAFPGGEEIELSWEIVDPLIKSWELEGHPEPYPKGSWGPQAADDLVGTDGGGRWIISGDEPGTS